MSFLKNKNTLMLIGYSLFLVVIIVFLFFNENGIMKYLSLKQKINSLNGEITKTESDIKRLEFEIDSLQNNQFKIEQVAREKYNMHREDEKAFKIEEK